MQPDQSSPQGAALAAENEALARLNEASSRIWHLADLAEGLEEILRAAIDLLGGHKGNVQLLGEDGLLRIVAHKGFDAEFLAIFAAVAPSESAACGRALKTGQRVVIEDVELDEAFAPLRAIAKAAGYRAVQSTPIVNRDGRRLGMISTHSESPHRPSETSLRLFDLYVRQAADFIDRCKGEQALRESEQQAKALSDIAPATILWATDSAGACTSMTRGWEEYTGQALERALGFGWTEHIHPADRERSRGTLLTASQKHEPFILDYRLRRADGQYRWVLGAGRPRYDGAGEFLGCVGSTLDVHERKLAEDTARDKEAILAGQKEAFQTAMDGQPLAACLSVLVRTVVAHYGDARAAFYMIGNDIAGGLHHVTGMSEEYARQVDGFHIGPESLACGLAMHRREPVITRDVEEDPRWEPWRWLARAHAYRACWSFPVQTSGGPVVGTLALYFPQPRAPGPDDLSLIASLAHAAAIIMSRHKEAADRARAEQALLDVNRRKDEFLAVLGHELRNPLAPLATAAELLDHARDKPELLDTVRPMMRRQVDHLVRLVDDLLDVSRISRGHAELQRAPLDVRAAIESAVEQSRPLIRSRRHTLRLELGDAPLVADGDFQRLTQVFGNLLGNAAKYSEPRGEITVRAAAVGDEAVIRVSDRGFGIPPERVGEVFEMFSQVPEHRSMVGGGGLGIGLALCRQLVELHGGSIEAHSEGLRQGSEFVVRLPLFRSVRDEGQAPAANRAPDTARRRVLVVDDNADAASLLKLALELHGHEALAVHSGRDALDALQQFPAEVVLLDLGMPNMDGFEVARRIRALPGGADIRLVALTGWGQGQDRQQTTDAGFDEHMTKPVDAARLSSLLARGERAAPKRVEPPPSATTTGRLA